MIKLKTTGRWKKLNALLKHYDKRIGYVEQRIALDVAKALLAKVKELTPIGQQYSEYVASLEVVELTGGKSVAFAVVSQRDASKIGQVQESDTAGRTVVYVTPSASVEAGNIVELIASVNPWPLDLLPHGLIHKDASLVHRVVSDGEMADSREQVMTFISENRTELKRAGLHWGKPADEEKDVSSMTSLPDYMWSALRAEFGINEEPKPHWRPAVTWLASNLLSIIDKDKVISETLTNELSREHTTQKGFGLPKMDVSAFKEEAGEFQKRVVSR